MVHPPPLIYNNDPVHVYVVKSLDGKFSVSTKSYLIVFVELVLTLGDSLDPETVHDCPQRFHGSSSALKDEVIFFNLHRIV